MSPVGGHELGIYNNPPEIWQCMPPSLRGDCGSVCPAGFGAHVIPCIPGACSVTWAGELTITSPGLCMPRTQWKRGKTCKSENKGYCFPDHTVNNAGIWGGRDKQCKYFIDCRLNNIYI